MQNKGFEGEAVRNLIAKLPNIEGCVLSMDALHCLNETFEQVVEDKGADMLVCVKDNRPTTRRTIDELLNSAPTETIMRNSQVNFGHGRAEFRSIEMLPCDPEQIGYAHIHTVARVFRRREIVRNGEVLDTQNETVHYIATFDAAETGPVRTLQMTRGHWAIENRLHHVKDVSMDEDRSRVANGVGRIMAAVRSVAALILNTLPVSARTAARRIACNARLVVRFLTCGSLEHWKACFAK